MVLKQNQMISPAVLMFENDVKMYGTQAFTISIASFSMFENDVKMYGTQAGKI